MITTFPESPVLPSVTKKTRNILLLTLLFYFIFWTSNEKSEQEFPVRKEKGSLKTFLLVCCCKCSFINDTSCESALMDFRLTSFKNVVFSRKIFLPCVDVVITHSPIVFVLWEWDLSFLEKGKGITKLCIRLENIFHKSSICCQSSLFPFEASDSHSWRILLINLRTHYLIQRKSTSFSPFVSRVISSCLPDWEHESIKI
jgi:hypothetical protein